MLELSWCINLWMRHQGMVSQDIKACHAWKLKRSLCLLTDTTQYQLLLLLYQWMPRVLDVTGEDGGNWRAYGKSSLADDRFIPDSSCCWLSEGGGPACWSSWAIATATSLVGTVWLLNLLAVIAPSWVQTQQLHFVRSCIHLFCFRYESKACLRPHTSDYGWIKPQMLLVAELQCNHRTAVL